MNKCEQLKQLTGHETAYFIRGEASKEFWKALENVKKRGSFSNIAELQIIMYGLEFMQEETKALEVGRELVHTQEQAHKHEWIDDMLMHYNNYRNNHGMDSMDLLINQVEGMLKTCTSDCDTMENKQKIKNKIAMMNERIKSY